jgi:hypothetical protein
VQIPLLSGIYATEQADFRKSLPVNLEPVLIDSGISKGYLRTAPGIVPFASSSGPDRGGILWNGTHYRVIGGSLVSISDNGATSALGWVDLGSPVTLDYSFDRLGIASNGSLYYWDGSTLTEVTDPDLGTVVDFIWIDGYFMTTDGASLIATELNDPTSVDPLKYGSSEVDPDPVTGLIKVRGEVYALNRYTIENFRNIGGNGFPFQRNAGAMIPKGCVGAGAKCAFLETFAFVGGGRNESVSVYLAGGGTASPIGTAEVDILLAGLSDAELAAIEMEAREDRDENRLLIHLPSVTLVYHHKASQANEEPIWAALASGSGADEPYPLRHLTLVGNRWIGGDSDGRVGYLSYDVETQFGDVAGWKVECGFIYNESRGAIVKSLELVGLPGRSPFGEQPRVFFSYTLDGETWSNERAIDAGGRGDRRKRICWRPMFRMGNYAGLRFRGADTAMQAWARLEADIEGLSV